MASSMTPSEVERISAGQIGKIQEVLGAALRKSSLLREPTQLVLGDPNQVNGMTDELVAVVQRRIEAVSNMIFRRVRVNRTRKPQELLDATGRAQHTDRGVVNEMPRDDNGEEEFEMGFFKLDLSASGGYISDDNLDKELVLRGLERDTCGQIQVNIDDPSFADEHPNGMHWKDKNGKWCHATFYRWRDERRVLVHRLVGGWWFGGRRKKALSPSGTGN